MLTLSVPDAVQKGSSGFRPGAQELRWLLKRGLQVRQGRTQRWTPHVLSPSVERLPVPWLVGLWLCRQTACVQPAQLYPLASPSLLSLSGEKVMKARSKDFSRSNETRLVSHGGCKGTLPPPAPQPGLLVPLAPSLGLSSVISVSWELAQAGGVAEEGPLLSPGVTLWTPSCSPAQLALAPSLLPPCLAPWLRARWRRLALTHF